MVGKQKDWPRYIIELTIKWDSAFHSCKNTFSAAE
jgi:hypothetical protein